MQSLESTFRFCRLGFIALGYHSYLKRQTMVARVNFVLFSI
jgi:hypothetical protein